MRLLVSLEKILGIYLVYGIGYFEFKTSRFSVDFGCGFRFLFKILGFFVGYFAFSGFI